MSLIGSPTPHLVHLVPVYGPASRAMCYNFGIDEVSAMNWQERITVDPGVCHGTSVASHVNKLRVGENRVQETDSRNARDLDEQSVSLRRHQLAERFSE